MDFTVIFPYMNILCFDRAHFFPSCEELHFDPVPCSTRWFSLKEFFASVYEHEHRDSEVQKPALEPHQTDSPKLLLECQDW